MKRFFKKLMIFTLVLSLIGLAGGAAFLYKDKLVTAVQSLPQ
ncbi:hypothetical protein [Effusibacillus consociatus]|uniref:Uncharacterized protein n=1 Tax=Effusibacillus consociatus TaxID=1117041 RepID=A0ABV9PZR1_9BACL